MVEKLKSHTQPTTIYKVKAHTNIDGNEQADILAKNGTKNIYINSLPNHMSLHILHHTTFKKTHGQTQENDLLKAMSDAWKHTSINTTKRKT